jgi:DNA topoisomerase-1
MAKKLVIVESPAKAKTIGGYLGKDYDVQASIGHIRDLPLNRKSMPEDLRKNWWADYAVDIDNGFKPFYEVPPDKKAQVQKLKKAMEGADTLILATDEDREGESISWHLLEVLKPKKSVQVQRIAFHEITREAIQEALAHPRNIDKELVEAQETRRILDRLYGYTLSPVLWSRISKDLSAGRVQSPAVKLIVDRERERRDFKMATYWDIIADVAPPGQKTFRAKLRAVDGKRIVTGEDFDDTTGQLKSETQQACQSGKCMMLEQSLAESLAESALTARPWQVTSVEQTEGQEKPPAPFMTTSLQQEANRKLGYPADRTMRIAQQLYEGIDLGGETVGLITYMRTDSLTLSDQAIQSTREAISRLYGADYLPDKPVRYTNKVRNAQEAHEAIRPTDSLRRPDDMAQFLTKEQLAIYELIWKRTVACQMKPARVLRTSVEIEVETPSPHGQSNLRFTASGRQIQFPGFLRAYIEGSDDPEAELEGQERILPPLKKGDVLDPANVEASGHETKPPPRYTDATLIKRLEKEGIGRPSTYASIISTIVDRGYVRKEGKQLVPTFRAFLAMEVLEKHFQEFMELGFTAKMDEELDDIARGKEDSEAYLRSFFLGDRGLKKAVDDRKKTIPYPAYEVGLHPETQRPIIVRLGKDGRPFLQHGLDGETKYANLPDNLPPAEVTLEKALELLNQEQKAPEAIGTDPATGRKLYLKNKNGFYLEVERTPEEIEAKVKPRFISVPKDATPADLTQDVLDQLASLPRVLGTDAEGREVSLKNGMYGMYVEAGPERRTVPDWRAALTMPLEDALVLLSQPKAGSREARQAAGPMRDFGEQAGAEGPVRVLSGRFGPYVTDGKTNATLPKGTDPAAISVEEALDLLAKKRAAGPSPRFRGRARGRGRRA